ncbi:unnamed protein product [Cylindrotheca closterium]|uniref:Nudix hydrolase domain-containing protein n=1 Tax=Cylindrotheca closterium TaxID=2856 RepID=A0AAD2GCR7_9STRA|nr:unnamed protein product [Cylindrotheca closterium]CAJ1970033.1 unnamed protein product [Cylindrotheca closterium]
MSGKRTTLLLHSGNNNNETKVVRVGVGVLVKDARAPDRVYCGIRKGSHGAGSLALPGGHLEMFESWEECAIREVKEETNLDLGEVSFGHVTNDAMERENKHYVTIFMLAKCKAPDQRPKTMEPNKCEGWNSYSWSELEKEHLEGNLFGPLGRLVKDRPSKVMEFLGLDLS